MRQTKQKEEMLNLLMEKPQHVSSEEIYRRLQERGSRVSRATVYRNMEAFAKEGVIVKHSGFAGKESFYDSNNSVHGHLLCTVCHQIYDLPSEVFNGIKEKAEGLGFMIDESSLSLNGICRRCREKEKKDGIKG